MNSASIVRDIASIGTALRRTLGITLALLRRELELRRLAPLESLLEMFETLILIGTLSLLRYYLDAHRSSPLGGSVVLFYASGLYPKYLFIYVTRFMPRGSRRSRFPIEQRLDHILVHIIFQIIEHFIFGIIVFGGIYIFLTEDAMPYNIFPIIPALTCSVMLGFGWGILNMALTRLIWFWQYFAGGINRVLILLSGAILVPEFLPPDIRYVFSFNPEMHVVALFRTAFYPHYPMFLLDTTYMACGAVFFLLFGLVVERITRRTERQ